MITLEWTIEVTHLLCCKGTGKWGHIVADTLLLMMFLVLRKLGNICYGHKMFLNKIRNIFYVPDTKFVSATNVARAGKHLCRQQCVLVCQGLKLLTNREGRTGKMLKGLENILRWFISDFSRRKTFFTAGPENFLNCISLGENVLLDGQTRRVKSSSQPVNLSSVLPWMKLLTTTVRRQHEIQARISCTWSYVFGKFRRNRE